MTFRSFSVALLIFAAVACKTASEQEASVKGSGGGGGADERPAQLYRFDPWLGVLKKALEANDAGTTIDTAAANIVEGQARIAAYNLQALCRLYSGEDEIFTKMRDDFKALEDVIGGWDKWNNILTRAKASSAAPDVLANLEKKRAAAMMEVKALLKDRKWFHPNGGESRIDKIEKHLAEYNWLKYKKDQALMLDQIHDELKAIDKTKYQFKSLETGDGLHELRRDLKWIVIEMRVLNGMIVFGKNPASCPVDAYAELVNLPIATSKYSALPASDTEKNACKIPQCLFLGLVQLVEELGAIKDEAETQINSNADEEESDKVPPALRQKAEVVYEAMTKNDLIKKMQKEIKSCED